MADQSFEGTPLRLFCAESTDRIATARKKKEMALKTVKKLQDSLKVRLYNCGEETDQAKDTKDSNVPPIMNNQKKCVDPSGKSPASSPCGEDTDVAGNSTIMTDTDTPASDSTADKETDLDQASEGTAVTADAKTNKQVRDSTADKETTPTPAARLAPCSVIAPGSHIAHRNTVLRRELLCTCVVVGVGSTTNTGEMQLFTSCRSLLEDTDDVHCFGNEKPTREYRPEELSMQPVEEYRLECGQLDGYVSLDRRTAPLGTEWTRLVEKCQLECGLDRRTMETAPKAHTSMDSSEKGHESKDTHPTPKYVEVLPEDEVGCSWDKAGTLFGVIIKPAPSHLRLYTNYIYSLPNERILKCREDGINEDFFQNPERLQLFCMKHCNWKPSPAEEEGIVETGLEDGQGVISLVTPAASNDQENSEPAEPIQRMNGPKKKSTTKQATPALKLAKKILEKILRRYPGNYVEELANVLGESLESTRVFLRESDLNFMASVERRAVWYHIKVDKEEKKTIRDRLMELLPSIDEKTASHYAVNLAVDGYTVEDLDKPSDIGDLSFMSEAHALKLRRSGAKRRKTSSS